MSWASRKRTVYVLGVVAFCAIVFGIPLAIWIYEPASCFDGKQNQEETAPDKGGPCALLDERSLNPYAVLWSRAFQIRPGNYNAAAYIENPNIHAGARAISYGFKFYDDQGVLVAERSGITSIMSGGITPVFEGAINTGNRSITRTFFEFTALPVWERVSNPTDNLLIHNKISSNFDSVPRLTARVKNTSVAVISNLTFVAVVFDTAGNAFAASATTLSRLAASEEGEIVFVWSQPFQKPVGRIDVVPFLEPVVEKN